MNTNNSNVDHWSYSSAKYIYRNGIDYAVAMKLGLIEKTFGKAVDIGRLIHAHLIGGEQDFVVSPYTDFRTKEAREWRDAQVLPIINEAEFTTITTVADRIKSHPVANKLIFDSTLHETRVQAKFNGHEWIGYADVIGYEGDKKNFTYLLDIKTTAQFDDFKWQARRNDYDLQAAVYASMANTADKPFYWVIAETIAPYRVGVAVASTEFMESGFQKLERVCTAIDQFKLRDGETDIDKLNFNQNTSMDDLLVIGDWS